MSPDAAIADILAEFPEAQGEARLSLHTDNIIEITSGGPRLEDREIEPALYATRGLAVVNFKREALDALRERAPEAIVFVDGPRLDNWLMTATDSRGTHRVVGQRFSASAKIGLINPKARKE